ncbi:MAG: hypothetical protein ACLUL2_12070 [Blautia sp.]
MAVKQYCSLDHEKNKEEMNRRNITIQNKIKARTVFCGPESFPKAPWDRDYPRLFWCLKRQSGRDSYKNEGKRYLYRNHSPRKYHIHQSSELDGRNIVIVEIGVRAVVIFYNQM